MSYSSNTAQSLVDVLQQHSSRFPARPAVTYLSNGEEEEVRLTYLELDARARAIAATLQEMGLAGERVMLAYPPGVEYICAFWGCLYAGATAVPIYPPRPSAREASLARIRAVAVDTRARLTLISQGVLDATPSAAAPLGESLFGSPLLSTHAVPAGSADHWRRPPIGPDTLAFLQYTSGSTSAPKGVMVSHGNILRNQEMIGAAFHFPDQFTVVGWLPLYHDMGLIGNLLGSACRGAHSVLMSPIAFLQRPVRWLRAISKYRAYCAGGPNFGYALCARKVNEQQKASLDLTHWRVAFNGAERIRADTLEDFASAFAPCGFSREAFLPCYGLAEATLLVSGGPAWRRPVVKHVRLGELEQGRVVGAATEELGTVPLVGCGSVQQEVRIVDPETRIELDAGRVGEIWVRGSNVAGGYWNHPDVSRDVFRASLAAEPGAEYLRTGDLGFVEAGDEVGQQLYVVGRLKDLIIIDGRNLHPEDVERTVERAHPEVRPGCCVAFSVVADDAEKLVVVAEVESSCLHGAAVALRGRDAVVADLVKRIKATIFREHDAGVHEVALVETGSVPKTSSGKLQRRACRAAFLAGELQRLRPDPA